MNTFFKLFLFKKLFHNIFLTLFDPLHIHNHKRKKCRELYNPDKVKEAVPEANLMCAEQTFAWFGRFKKICNSMSKIHFHFVLHRLIKQRNAYTSHCYKNGKKPLLPSAKIAKTDNVVWAINISLTKILLFPRTRSGNILLFANVITLNLFWNRSLIILSMHITYK